MSFHLLCISHPVYYVELDNVPIDGLLLVIIPNCSVTSISYFVWWPCCYWSLPYEMVTKRFIMKRLPKVVFYGKVREKDTPCSNFHKGKESVIELFRLRKYIHNMCLNLTDYSEEEKKFSFITVNTISVRKNLY